MPTLFSFKRCPRCGEEKPTTAYVANRSKASGYDSYCRGCRVDVNREWNERNRGKRGATNRRATAAWKARHRTYYNEQQRGWQARNRENVRAANRRWAAKHPERHAQTNAAYRARKAGAPGFASTTQIQARVTYYGSRCWICREPHEALDHVKPLNAGGSNWPANLRPICRACNAAKADRWPLPAS